MAKTTDLTFVEDPQVPFAEAFPQLAIHGKAPTNTTEGRRMDRLTRELMNRLNLTKWTRATVVNLHPFDLFVDFGYNGRLKVPATKKGQLYRRFVLDDPLFHPIEKPEGERDVAAILPIEQAVEFVREYRLTPAGHVEGAPFSVGVLWYEGDAKEVPAEYLQAAQSLMFDWYAQLFEEAENSWSKSKNRREITDHMKTAANSMFERKLIKALPEWVYSSAATETPKMTVCPGCAAEVKEAAAFCTACMTMLKPDVVKVVRPDIYYAQRPFEKPTAGAPATAGGLHPLKTQVPEKETK